MFEFFEVAPTNHAAMSTVGRLKRQFPASSVSIPSSVFDDQQLHAALADTISTMGRQEIAEMKPRVKKSGNNQIEERDTTDPAIVTDFLATTLCAMGSLVQLPAISKNTREQICWSDALLPWRRSPCWLLARVTIQVIMSRAHDPVLYKRFMVFFMARVLSLAVSYKTANDLLYCMVAKISGRLQKLDRSGEHPWLQQVEASVSDAVSLMRASWETTIQNADPPQEMKRIPAECLERDTTLNLPKLQSFLESIKNRTANTQDRPFTSPWSVPMRAAASLPPAQFTKQSDGAVFELLAFEEWVASALDNWIGSNILREETPRQLFSLMEAYHSAAQRHYAHDPQAISLMVLNILELWVALDKSVCKIHPLLMEYDHEIPYHLLQSLVLPFRSQMERAHNVETYMQARRSISAEKNRPSIFLSFGEANSFGVRFFDSSTSHQERKAWIEREADQERETKKREFTGKKTQYDDYMARSRRLDCEYYSGFNRRTGRPFTTHSKHCDKCRLEKLAADITIALHEWPLPSSTCAAQNVVFELDVPKSFDEWRNATSFIVLTVLQSKNVYTAQTAPEVHLDRHLQRYYRVPSKLKRFALASRTKSHQRTHRKLQQLATSSVEDVLVSNGLSCQYYDRVLSKWTAEVQETKALPKQCTYTLSKACTGVPEFMFRPHQQPNGQTPNHIISQQSQCPEHLSLEEFKAMTAIPCGHHIQWGNILAQLHMPSINFTTLDTCLLLLQVSCQAGPPEKDDVHRASHQPLKDEEFVVAFIKGLGDLLQRSKRNWEAYNALYCIVILTARVLSLASGAEAALSCLNLLTAARGVALEWLEVLQERVKSAETDQQRNELIQNLLHVAHVGMASFDVDNVHLPAVLQSASSTAALLEMSIIAHNATASKPGADIYGYAPKKILFRAFRLLSNAIVNCASPSMDMALRNCWARYSEGAGWSIMSDTDCHWLVTRTRNNTGGSDLNVQYNLLTGELLVNGFPLTRLPANYEALVAYTKIFGTATIEILPTDMPGMEFSSKNFYHGHALFFGLSSATDPDLLLVTKRGTEVYDLVPARVFYQVLPEMFSSKYIHWYSRSSNTIEFRDKNAPWTASPESNWVLAQTGQGWTLARKNARILIGPETESAKYFHNLFKPLEAREFLHISLETSSGNVEIELPRLKLDFTLQAACTKVRSRQYRDMYIDSNRRIDALVGFDSKIVLRSDQNRRKILVPDGEPQLSHSATNHPRISVSHGSSRKAHIYDLDNLLCRIVDNGSLESKLIICYLHALTSSCLPDRLTGRTGTEQALSILRSASLNSFECLSKSELQRLQKLARLSPKRAYYPPHLQLMESIRWNDKLSFLSQDVAFNDAVQNIFHRASTTKIFYPTSYIQPPELDHVDPRLGKRQLIRAASFQVHGFGAENRHTKADQAYRGRDLLQCSERSRRAFNIGCMLRRQHNDLVEPLQLRLTTWLWDFFNGEVAGSMGKLVFKDICYDAKWLESQKPVLQAHWCQLHRLLAETSDANPFRVFFFLSVLAYADSGCLQILQILALIYRHNNSSNGIDEIMPNSAVLLGSAAIPSGHSFYTPDGRAPDTIQIRSAAEQHSKDFTECAECNIPRDKDEEDETYFNRRYQIFSDRKAAAIDEFVEHLYPQWVCSQPTPTHKRDYFDVTQATAAVSVKWNSWYHNYLFYEYLDGIATAVQAYKLVAPPSCPSSSQSLLIPYSRSPGTFIHRKDLFCFDGFSLPNLESTDLDLCQPSEVMASEKRLNGLLGRLGNIPTALWNPKNYTKSLMESLDALEGRSQSSGLSIAEPNLAAVLDKNLRACQGSVDKIYDVLQSATLESLLQIFSSCRGSLSTCKSLASFMAPRMSPSILLGNLTSTEWRQLSDPWKKAIVFYGISLTKLQQAIRLVNFKSLTDVVKELSNPGHTNWNPLDRPESLLLEVESGIMIREVQEDIASEMRNPEGSKNAVMQLNMGEGKSSVIVPIVATDLADGQKLVRVIVAKPQAKELLRTLVSKLSGLLNRRIYHMPVNRSLRLTAPEVRQLAQLFDECRKQGGILLCQPEHILSFKLMAIEYQSSIERQEAAGALLDLYHEFEECARDIVDESDENFSPKFELVYTMGVQRPVELSPERWTTLQKVLEVVKSTVSAVEQQAPESLEISHSALGRFPRTRILRDDAGVLLLQSVAQRICETGLPGLPIGRQSKEMRQAIYEYILIDELSVAQVAAVEDHSFFTDALKGPLLLIRGLLAGRVLLFGLKQKRWRVNYGLDSSRVPNTKLAVPYRAKDSPSPRSEFSHPDVVILLTSLSYYYGGLSDDEMFASFEHLMKSDQSDIEYQAWVMDAPELPVAFRSLAGVNIKDTSQVVSQVFPPLRHAKSTVDYFLSQLVFPKEMKEFSHKLSASGWDLGEQKKNPTTGFSGTNDSRHVLPLDVKQLEIPAQLHTNALVLETLLQPENTVQVMQPLLQPDGSQNRDSTFLDELFAFVAGTENTVHVILDVGAQVLELTNVEVARKWLEQLPSGEPQEAVVYFNDHDELFVLDRKGTTENLRTSPYAEQLGRCLVFLDQAHTRGTDLKLPDHYRAAVTLGPDLTKDGLAQACMRMRKLGQGQSVVFCISQEMQFRVNAAAGKPHLDGKDITVEDVLMWAIYETHADLHRVMPLWAMQGTRFEWQKREWAKTRTPTGIIMSQNQAEALLEPESQTIDYRYRPTVRDSVGELQTKIQNWNLDADENPALVAIQVRCEEFGVSKSTSAILQEEQEKELAPEVEEERQIQRPEPVPPAPHEVHRDVLYFATTGAILDQSTAFCAAFLSLSDTSVAALADLKQFPSSLLATTDYARTVKLASSTAKSHATKDSYQRPIQWILTGHRPGAKLRAVIISPFEANELMPRMKQSKSTHLHLYSPRSSLAFAAIDNLRLYAVPPLPDNWQLPEELRLQLNLFSGQLYFSSYTDYQRTCDMLQLAWEPPSSPDVVVEADGFMPAITGTGEGNYGRRMAAFDRSPVQSIKALLMLLRRDCCEIGKTHWGRVLAGEMLTEKDFSEERV